MTERRATLSAVCSTRARSKREGSDDELTSTRQRKRELDVNVPIPMRSIAASIGSSFPSSDPASSPSSSESEPEEETSDPGVLEELGPVVGWSESAVWSLAGVGSCLSAKEGTLRGVPPGRDIRNSLSC